MDDRARVVQEILEGERKYLQDLELLQHYRQTLHTREVLSSDQIRALFKTLNPLIAFQRVFLASVESNARLPADEQRFGLLFTSLEKGFSCYESFCANFPSANQFIQDEKAVLTLVADIIPPKYELPLFLIKPYGRLFKYPLFLQRLLEYPESRRPLYNELQDGFASITRVINKVNQTIWKREKELVVNNLKDQVEDWKGHDVFKFGQLLLNDKFTVMRKNKSKEYDYHVYLFERVILFCKEVRVKLNKKSKKRLMNIMQNPQISNPIHNGAHRKNNLLLKGRIFTANIISASPSPIPPGFPDKSYILQAKWRGDEEEESFSIRCRTNDQLIKWQAAINKAAQDVARRRRQTHPHLYPLSRPQISSPLSRFTNSLQSEMEDRSSLSGYPSILGIQHPYTFLDYDDDDSSMHSNTLVDEEENYRTSFANTRSHYFHALTQITPSNRLRLGRRVLLCD